MVATTPAPANKTGGTLFLRSVVKAERVKGGKYLYSDGNTGTWDGRKLRCEHQKERYSCKDCNGGGICEHKRQKRHCKDCRGTGICIHGREKRRCKECTGTGICEHGKDKRYCKPCGGSGICEHQKYKTDCRECRSAREAQGAGNANPNSIVELTPHMPPAVVAPVAVKVQHVPAAVLAVPSDISRVSAVPTILNP